MPDGDTDTVEAAPATGRDNAARQVVAEAADRWADDVARLGGRNTLLRFQDLKAGTLDVAAADPEARRRLVEGEPVLVSRLFPREPLRSSALRSARAIYLKVRELAEERGVWARIPRGRHGHLGRSVRRAAPGGTRTASPIQHRADRRDAERLQPARCRRRADQPRPAVGNGDPRRRTARARRPARPEWSPALCTRCRPAARVCSRPRGRRIRDRPPRSAGHLHRRHPHHCCRAAIRRRATRRQ